MLGEGAELAMLLLAGFRTLVEQGQTHLDQAGHPGIRPVHYFALLAVADGASSTSELGRRLGVSKQAAAKTVSFLIERGYLDRAADEADARRKTLGVSERGADLVTTGQKLFDDLRRRWAETIGETELDTLQAHLRHLTPTGATRFDTAGWLADPT